MVDVAAWYANPAAPRVIIAEVAVRSGGVETTRYISTAPYVSGPTDNPPNQYYEPVIVGGLQFTERLDIDGTGGLSGGDLDIGNYGGERDSWLEDIWDNRTIVAWLGDPGWNKSDFQPILNGVVATVDCKSKDTITLILRDKMQRLNTPVTDQKIGGTGTNKDEVVNLSFGECHNVTPNLITDANAGVNGGYLPYKVHNAPIEDIIEVRDNGVPVDFVKHLSTGTFVLTAQSFGAITASVQGDKNTTYVTTVDGIIQRLVTGYGAASTRYSTSDIDTSNFAAFAAAHPQQVGAYVEGGDNLLSVCQGVAKSLDARLVTTRTGLLQLLQIRIPSAGEVTYTITPSQMVSGSLQIVKRPLVQAAVSLGYNKNYTVQKDLVTNIPDEHKKMFAEEWLGVTSTNGSAKSNYRLNEAPPQVETLLLTGSDATAEANRRKDLWSTQRTVFQFVGTAELIGSLSLGMPVGIQHERYGLSGTKFGIVTSLSPNWFKGNITVEVLV